MSRLQIVGSKGIQLDEDEDVMIGAGRFCTVHPGRFDERDVAVKRVNDPARSRLAQELSALRKFENPNIVRYIVYDEDVRFSYIVMERCICSLLDVIHRRAVIDVSELDILQQASLGLYYLHENGIRHRNIHPSNILVARVGNETRIKLSDFGLVKESPDNRSISSSVTSRSHRYSSPEERRKERTSKETDVFSLGVCFFELLSGGQNPYGDSDADIEYRIGTGVGPTMNRIVRACHGYAIALIRSMLWFEKRRRPEMRKLLGHFVFWDTERTTQFVQRASDDLFENQGFNLTKKMEKESFRAIGHPLWERIIYEGLEPRQIVEMRSIVGKFPCKPGVKGVLRLFRNWLNHFENLGSMKLLFQSSRAGLVQFFKDKFPELLPVTYEVFEQKRNVKDFKIFYFYD